MGIKLEAEKECQRMEEDALYSGKAHYNASSCWRLVNYLFGIPSIICTTLASIDYNSYAAAFSAIAAVLVSLQTFIGASDKVEKHSNSGNGYFSLKNKIRLFRKIELPIATEKEISSFLKIFLEEKDRLNNLSPSIPFLAFWLAKKGIEKGQANYKVDEKNKTV